MILDIYYSLYYYHKNEAKCTKIKLADIFVKQRNYTTGIYVEDD